jgi:hypothetical protein
MTKKELQRQIDDLRDRVSMLENKMYERWTQSQTWTMYPPSTDPVVPMGQPTSAGYPLPFPCPTTTHI